MFKFIVVVLAALTVVSGSSEKQKRQSGPPDFSEFFNQFQEHMKPISGQIPFLPGGSGSFPSFPGVGQGSGSGGSPQFKRQISPNTVNEWLSQFQGAGSNFPGNLPFKPPQFGQFPLPGSSSGASETSENQNS